MIEYIKYRFKLNEINRRKEGTQRHHSKILQEERQKKASKDELDGLQFDEYFEVGMIQEEIDILVTNYLRKIANRLFVPIPDYNNKKMWSECDKISRQKVLTSLGITTIKSAIRKERKEKIEIVVMVTASLTGLIGAITGLLAISK